MCMYAKVVVVLYCLQIPRYFVVEDVIWDAATTVIMIMITVRISYSSFLLSTSILPRYTYILFVGGMNLTSILSLFLLLLVFTSHPWQNPSSDALLAPSLYVERETR